MKNNLLRVLMIIMAAVIMWFFAKLIHSDKPTTTFNASHTVQDSCKTQDISEDIIWWVLITNY